MVLGHWVRPRLETQTVVNGPANHPESVRFARLLRQTWLEWFQSRTLELGAALAFYAIFSIAPVIVLAFTAASVILGSEAAQGRLTQEIESTVGRTVAGAIQATAQYTYRSGSGIPATILSIVFFGFGATGLFSQLQSALNAIWEVERKRGRGLRGDLHDRFGSFLAVVGISALLLADLLVTAVLSSLRQIMPSSPTPQGFPLWWAVTFAVSWAFLTLAIALVYRILPDAKIAWRDVWVGAGSSGLLLLLGNHLIGWCLAAAGIASAYGAAGSIVIVLLWVYYSSQVVLFGAVFTRVYAKHRGSPLEPKENAVRVDGTVHA
jgi:membrane protein